jgi:hypothetical protein
MKVKIQELLVGSRIVQHCNRLRISYWTLALELQPSGYGPRDDFVTLHIDN